VRVAQDRGIAGRAGPPEGPADGLAEGIRARLAAEPDAPLHARLGAAIRAAIRDGDLRPGARLPGERDLAAGLDVSRVTLRRALEDLSAAGLLQRQHGARSVVMPRLEKAVSRLTGFSDDMRARGRAPGARWLSRAVATPTPAEVRGARATRSGSYPEARARALADGEPVAVERAAIPLEALPDPDLVVDSLYQALEARGLRPVRGTQRMRAEPAREAEARVLGVPVGTPLFCVERRCFAASGLCVEFTETRYLGTAYDFVTDLTE
jgi:GntR family transcriptional regulator